jgi:SAM-dependent methyltransferase
MTNDISLLNPTTRFSNRVDNYVKYRPGYPEEIIRFLETHFGLAKDHQIADVGSGTGIFTELLLKNGFPVTAIEPNDEMRKAAELRLKDYSRFSSRKATAENTGLKTGSIYLVTVAQAFHWMEPAATKREFERILAPGGTIALIWNLRLQNTPFLKSLEELKIKYGNEGYQRVHRADEEAINSFFKPKRVESATFPNRQMLDFNSLKGQLLSASYIPLEGEPGYEEMIRELSVIFDACNEQGQVRMEYETKLYYAL